jgi:hypothetical protein
MAHDRCPPYLRGASRAQFIALQREFDARLAAAGFRDIEYGADTLRMNASTFSENVSLDSLGDPRYRELRLGDHDRAEYWRAASAAAHWQPRAVRQYLLAVCETGIVLGDTARQHGLTVKRARGIWRRFVVSIGLPDPYIPRRTRTGMTRRAGVTVSQLHTASFEQSSAVASTPHRARAA